MDNRVKYGMKLKKLIPEVRRALRSAKVDIENELRLGGTGCNVIKNIRESAFALNVIDILLKDIQLDNECCYSYGILYSLTTERSVRSMTRKAYRRFNIYKNSCGSQLLMDVLYMALSENAAKVINRLNKKYSLFISSSLYNKVVAIENNGYTREEVIHDLRKDGFGVVEMYDREEERDVFVLVHK